MEVEPTEAEIEQAISEASKFKALGSSGKTFEEGVQHALEWVLGNSDSPMEDLEI